MAQSVREPVSAQPLHGSEGASTSDLGWVDVLLELVADRLAHFQVRLAAKIVGGREPGEIGTVSRSQTMTVGFIQLERRAGAAGGNFRWTELNPPRLGG